MGCQIWAKVRGGDDDGDEDGVSTWRGLLQHEVMIMAYELGRCDT
jgi:hypothetical protein